MLPHICSMSTISVEDLININHFQICALFCRQFHTPGTYMSLHKCVGRLLISHGKANGGEIIVALSSVILSHL